MYYVDLKLDVHCTLYIVHCTLYTVHCTMYSVHCTVYIVHYIQCIKPKPNQYLYELGNEIQRRRLVNLVWLTIGGSCVCIEETTADLFYRRGEHNHINVGVYELYG